MLEVSLLGEQYITGSSLRQVRHSSRSIALLAYLALHADAPQSRLRIACTFWPDSTEGQARTNLRRELHYLRQLLDDDPSLLVEAATLTWRDQSTCRVDLRTFERERRCALDTSDVAKRMSHARCAVGAYGGDLLPGAYDDWVLEERQRLRRDCVALLDTLVRDLREQGDLEAAVDFARHRVAQEPLEEVGYRVLMQLHAERGDRAGAISTFHRCAAILERELGVEPSPETTDALERLLGDGTRSVSAVPATRARSRIGSTTATTFVGRERERALLTERWRRAVDGEPGVLLVSGEAGVGKSRLAGELAALAKAEGALVTATRCFGMARRLALAPVADWLRSPGFGRAIRELPPVWRAEVARLVPDAAAGSPDVPHQTEIAADADIGSRDTPATRAMVDAWRRHRFYEGLARAVLAVDRPTLLLLDDLHWCDEETAAWLSFLVRLAEHAPLLVVTTARSDELDHNPEVAQLLSSSTASGPATEVGLQPLRRAEVRALADSLLDRSLSDDEAVLLSEATGGYPLYVVEAISDVSPADAPTAHLNITADLSGVLHHRLETASTQAREVAGLAAAYGREFSLDLLTEASDLDAETVVRAVDELWRRRIVHETGADYDFSHDLVRESAYESVSPPRRWLLHRRLAQGLELLYAGREHEVATQLAEQYDRGGRPDRARRYYRIAAQQAAAVFAHGEALRLFRRCLDLTDKIPAGVGRDHEQLDLLLAMSAPTTALYGYASARVEDTLTRCAGLAERLGRQSDLLAARAGLFAVRFVQGRTQEAYDYAVAALELADIPSALAAQAHLVVAGSSTSLGKLAQAEEHFQIARDLAHGTVSMITGVLVEAHSYAWHGHLHWLLGDDAAAVASCRAGVDVAESAGHPYSLVAALGYLATTHQLRGDQRAAVEAAARLVEICERYEFAWYVEWGRIVAGWSAGGEAGIATVNAALARLRDHASYARMPYWLCLLAELHQQAGAHDKARPVLDAAVAMAEQNDERWWLPEALRRKAQLADVDAAVPLLSRATRLARDQGSVVLRARCERDLAGLGVPQP